MAKYLDKSGVTYLWNKIKELFTDQSLNTKNKTYAGAINEINTKVGNLTGAFLWKGKFDTLPAVTDYEAGNVVGVGKKEYVLTVTEGTKAWEEFGDEGSYLLKTTAESTYLKKAAGEVKTANLADNAVISTKLAKGARKPIILTPSTTEVDEETYQKLSSQEGTDVILNLGDGIFVELQGIFNTGDTLILIFGYSQFDESNDGVISTYTITINTSAPHTLTLAVIGACEPVSKSTLTPVLQEIDLSGTDADRKAKLDQFETDWKALTDASDLTGARFVGYYSGSSNSRDTLDLIISTLLVWDDNEVSYHGFGVDDSGIKRLVYLGTTGSITCANIMEGAFSHLEAITIYTDNTPEHMQANLDNITAYEANLQALEVDTVGVKAPIIPIYTADGNSPGFIQRNDTGLNDWTGICTDEDVLNQITISIDSGRASVHRVALYIDVVDKTLNAKSLEAITIYTDNTDKHKAANVAAIKAYVDNLIALGVDTTKGYIIPITDGKYQGTLMSPDSRKKRYRGQLYKDDEHYCPLYIEEDGAINVSDIFISYTANLSTTSTQVVGAINEVNALAKSKQDKLTSGTNIKTVNGQSLLGSGDIAISGGGGDVTAAGNNTFTGTNTFDTVTNLNSGLIIRDATNDDRYKIHGDAFGLIMQNIDDLNSDIGIRGVLSPVQDNDAANKSYVDTQISTALGTVLTQLQNI